MQKSIRKLVSDVSKGKRVDQTLCHNVAKKNFQVVIAFKFLQSCSFEAK